MKKYILLCLALVPALVSCGKKTTAPRPAVQLVYNIAADSVGTARLVAQAGSRGADGSIAVIGEPADAIILARRFQSVDRMDNIDGQPVRDSLPDFAGESFHVIADAYNAPYAHFWQESAALPDSVRHFVLDSLREAAVQDALFAWDTTGRFSLQDPAARLRKAPAKLLIFTSSLQAKWGLFDVDTLQTLCGGHSVILSPMEVMLDRAYAGGARRMAVWTSRDVRDSGAWSSVFSRKAYPDATLSVMAPEPALDVRTQLRILLRQYQAEGRPLDALLIDSYTIDPGPLNTEVRMIRRIVTEEDAAFDKMLSPDFVLLDPVNSVIDATYSLLREKHLFTHRIARPALRYFETVEGEDGEPVLLEIDATYAVNTYVSNLN